MFGRYRRSHPPGENRRSTWATARNRPARIFTSCLPRHVQPGVDVRGAAEVPREGGTFELPDVPDAVVADVAFFEVRQAQLVGTARGVEAFADLGGVAGTEGAKHHLQELADHV